MKNVVVKITAKESNVEKGVIAPNNIETVNGLIEEIHNLSEIGLCHVAERLAKHCLFAHMKYHREYLNITIYVHRRWYRFWKPLFGKGEVDMRADISGLPLCLIEPISRALRKVGIRPIFGETNEGISTATLDKIDPIKHKDTFFYA